nr:PREDICTED: protein MB21D2 [Anolis carolinensis]|eukprot:XP_003230474.2 PREDICTED: protein MB21D2 [Anolis carolinensis]
MLEEEENPTPEPGKEADPWSPKPAPAKPLTDLDFRSGARIEELNQLIQEYEARNVGAIRDAPELHQAKDRVFSLLALAQRSDPRLPVVNRYLLLSGGVQQCSVHLNVGRVPVLSPGTDYDAAFTLLVPILNAAGVPVTLDMTQSPVGHTRLSLQPFDPAVVNLWSELGDEEAYLAADRVSEWFFRTLSTCAEDTRVERRSGVVTSVIVCAGPLRVLYDVIPVVAFRGWPEVAQPWLTQTHFWDGKLQDEEVAGGFYLLPSSGNNWRLAFSASELNLRRMLPLPLAWAFRAAAAAISGGGLLGGGVGPYHLFTLALWSCERLPNSFLAQEENAAHAMLGLLDDLLASLVGRQLPSYFLPEWNLLECLSWTALERLAHEVARVRAKPAEHLRQAVERAKEAKRVARALREQKADPKVD